ncbi:MAG: nucleotidyltransferase substrate binding protein [Candidatus Omnitrophica bacterium]|nr:HI0074 family nucleotidyltransferase substrate-binding subunit [Candidatus Omnitrophota bacterium]MCB9747572.1 nucleotidyltransferase substrate binding protein [Candidatus Omnitrophota bacterium]
MKNELEKVLINLKDAFQSLEEGCMNAKDQLDKDGVIQRFEFTFELMWKALRIYLHKEGVLTKSPRETLKEAFRLGWILEEQVFLKMLEDRNETTHVYSKVKADEIFQRINKQYVTEIKKIILKLDNI